MSTAFQKISEIDSSKSSWNIKAKVIRLWTVTNFNRNALPFSVEMVLMDSEGGRIHCTIKKTLLYKFQNEVKEGNVYAFENLESATNGGNYMTTNHEYKLNFQFGSKLLSLVSTTVSGSPFKFVPISDINSGVHDSDYLVDVIGMLTGVGEERQYDKNGETSKLNVIALEADGHKIQCTLFGSYVDDLNNFLSSGETQNAVVVIMLGKVKTFQDKVHIQNCIKCTKVFFNPTSDEALSFKTRMLENAESPVPPTVTQIAPLHRVDPAQDFLYSTPRTTIHGLLNCAQDAVFVVLGTIKHIVNNDNDSWYYTACVCNKSAYPDEGMFFCEKCNKHVKTVFPRFSIKVRVMDDTDTAATFVVFDRDASMLFNKSCADVLQARDRRAGVGALPAEIQALINCTYLFKVECKSDFSSKFDRSFRVRKICTDMVIINQFKSKWAHEEAVFANNSNEITSLSDLLESNVGGSNNVLSHDVEPFTASSAKGKELKMDTTKLGISQDLLPAFTSAVIDLDSMPSPKKIDVKGKAPIADHVAKGKAPIANHGAKGKALIDDHAAKGKAPIADHGAKGNALIDHHAAKGKRTSPNEDKDEDNDLPIKLLKRSIKIEKI